MLEYGPAAEVCDNYSHFIKSVPIQPQNEVVRESIVTDDREYDDQSVD
jgi:hypothetical protein